MNTLEKISEFFYFHGKYIIIFLITISVVAFLVAVWISDTKQCHKLMNQCISDGHKEYECVSMLKRNTNQVVPIYMPIYR